MFSVFSDRLKHTDATTLPELHQNLYNAQELNGCYNMSGWLDPCIAEVKNHSKSNIFRYRYDEENKSVNVYYRKNSEQPWKTLRRGFFKVRPNGLPLLPTSNPPVLMASFHLLDMDVLKKSNSIWSTICRLTNTNLHTKYSRKGCIWRLNSFKSYDRNALEDSVDGTDPVPYDVRKLLVGEQETPEGNVEEHRRSLENAIEILFQHHGGKKHLIYRPLIFVDARNKEDKEISILKKQLVDIALDHPRCGENMPTKFVPLELQLSVKVEAEQKIVAMNELEEMNKQNENMALNDNELRLFLKVNHALGKLIYLDETGLRDPVFLVDVLRSIVTEKQFWPQHLLYIFEALRETGELLKEDLYEMWKQKCFQTISKHKEYMVEMLVHLDILCRQKDTEKGFDFFLVPCMIRAKRKNRLQMQLDKSIHLAYQFREEVIPPAILYRFLATFISMWNLRFTALHPSEKRRLMLFTDSADVIIDKEHDMRFDIQGN
ncbi:unnamed protein product [Mytilus coruscus]|uniref:DUF7869 domain-containing protein n=1 Tax=Mytilus coruscus TaxID=42192 RepID=A0A6J8C1C2_MYTCO|nr:unnamed protein product [Mytilus coruscus]